MCDDPDAAIRHHLLHHRLHRCSPVDMMVVREPRSWFTDGWQQISIPVLQAFLERQWLALHPPGEAASWMSGYNGGPYQLK